MNQEKDFWTNLFTKYHSPYNDIQPKIIEFKKKYLSNKVKNLLDLGCGEGKISLYFASKGINVIGIDHSEKALESARINSDKQNIKNVKFILGDILDTLPFKANTFDVVLCIWVVSHFTPSNIQKIIDEVYRVLKPNGIFYVDFLSKNDETYSNSLKRNNVSYEQKITHYYFSKEEVKQFFQNYKLLSVTETKFKFKKYNKVDRNVTTIDVVAKK